MDRLALSEQIRCPKPVAPPTRSHSAKYLYAFQFIAVIARPLVARCSRSLGDASPPGELLSNISDSSKPGCPQVLSGRWLFASPQPLFLHLITLLFRIKLPFPLFGIACAFLSGVASSTRR